MVTANFSLGRMSRSRVASGSFARLLPSRTTWVLFGIVVSRGRSVEESPATQASRNLAQRGAHFIRQHALMIDALKGCGNPSVFEKNDALRLNRSHCSRCRSQLERIPLRLD